VSATKLITAPATDPVDFDLLKKMLRIDDTDRDDILAFWLKAATGDVETLTGRALIDQTWDVYFDRFPPHACYSSRYDIGGHRSHTDLDSLEIPKPPLIEIIGVFYKDINGDEQEFTGYEIDNASEPARIFVPNTVQWPQTSQDVGSIRVRFRAGYLNSDSPPAAAVPQKVQSAVALYVQAYLDGGDDGDKCRARAADILQNGYMAYRGFA
jgi:hypothetical protein